LRWRVAFALLRIWLLYRWRRHSLGWHLPLEAEPDHRGGPLPRIDTGGIYRAPFGSQFGDPTESHTSPHSEGSNCTMAAAGMALAHETGGRLDKRAGDMRHKQGDSEGGTDLYDAAEAWAHYGHNLSIWSGRGWGAVTDALEAGRGVILQGTGGLAGCGDYTGGHAIYVAPERSGSRWLKGDPECTGYEWCEARDLEAFAERLSPGVMFAVTKAGEVGEVAGLKLEGLETWSGKATMAVPGASAIQVADRQLVGLPVGAQKRGYFRAKLGEPWGSAWPIGTPVVGIGDELAVLIEAQCDLEADPPDDDDYNQGRADEWDSWAEGLGIPPKPT
jgi:hypothetical protein